MPSGALISSPSPSAPRAVVLFCASPSKRLRVKFDGLHTALERAADQRPLISVQDLPAAIKSRSRFVSSGVHRTLGIRQSFSGAQTPALQAGHHAL